MLPIELKAINDHDIAASHVRRALKELWGKRSAENIVKSGQVLKEARERLPHGHFDELLTEFDIEKTKAKKLIRIGGNIELSSHVHQMPSSYTTLYLLSRLKSTKLKDGIANGTITKSLYPSEDSLVGRLISGMISVRQLPHQRQKWSSRGAAKPS